MKELVKKSSAEVVAMYEGIGKTAKQIESLTFEASETPLSGIIGNLLDEPKEYQGNKYFVYEVLDDNDKVIGEISVNRLFDTEVKQGDVLIVANGDNKGRAMLRSHRLTSTAHLGKSRAEQIANATGKRYTATREAVSQPKDFTKIFSAKKSYKMEKEVEETVKELLWKNTQINEKAMAITWV